MSCKPARGKHHGSPLISTAGIEHFSEFKSGLLWLACKKHVCTYVQWVVSQEDLEYFQIKSDRDQTEMLQQEQGSILCLKAGVSKPLPRGQLWPMARLSGPQPASGSLRAPGPLENTTRAVLCLHPSKGLKKITSRFSQKPEVTFCAPWKP